VSGEELWRAPGAAPGEPPDAVSTTATAWLALEVFGAGVRIDGEVTSPPGSMALHIDLGAIPVGHVLGQLVSWAERGRTVTFDPPWDRLLDLTLPPVTFSITSTPAEGVDEETTRATTAFAVTADKLGVDFAPFLTLDSLTLSYTPASKGVPKSVDVAIVGSFLGQSFDPDHPLTWDALSSPPPAVPSAASKVLELRYLGLGQRVAVTPPVHPDGQNPTLWDLISSLEKAFAPVPEGQTPITDTIEFAADGGWLVGIDFTLLDTLTLAALFDDPAMYGLHIALDGPKAGPAAGLVFDILYRKVGDNLGVYHAELTLPDALRHIDLGAVAITLPTIAVDVYTNGNFLIDLGFPYQLDFSRSFGIQMLPFVGAGGLYFGVLSQGTAPALPQVTSGSFSPVIAFGLGLQVGVGRTVSYGVLSGGITVTVQGTVEGLIAGWRPGSGSDVAAVYYRITGQVSVAGHLYGAIDFEIIKASVDVYAYAGVAIVMESHRTTQLTLSAGVEMRVSVKVVFFTVHLSFSASIEESFEIGSSSTAPWDAHAAVQRIESAGLPALTTAEPLPGLGQAWVAVDLVETGVRASKATVKVAFVPQVAFGAVGPPGSGNEAKLVALCFTDAAMPGAATAAPTAGTTSFEALAGALLDWGLHLAGEQGATISQAAVNGLFAELAKREGDGGMTTETVLRFLVDNIEFQLSDGSGFDTENATVFPMLPWLRLDSAAAPAYSADFATHTPAPPGYRDELGVYFAQLDPSSDGPTGLGRAQAAEVDLPVPGSLAAVVLADSCKLILRQLLGDALTRFAGFTRDPAGDDVDNGYLTWLGSRYGLGPDAVEQIALANQGDAGFRAEYSIVGGRAQVRTGETPDAFCQRAAIGLADLANTATDSQGFLAPGALATIATGQYKITADDVTRRILAPDPFPVATDLLKLLSDRFRCAPDELRAENPSVSLGQWTSLGPGETRTPEPLGVGDLVKLPRLAVDTSGLTLAELATRYGETPLAVLTENADNPALLAPLFSVDLPELSFAAQGATPLEVAQRFGVTVADLVAANDTGASDFGPVVLPGCTSMPVVELSAAVLSGGAVSGAAGAVARFLLHGLRLPAPDGTALGVSDALYTLTGQQFPAPTSPEGAGLVLDLTATAGLATPVIELPGSEPLAVTLAADAVAAVASYRALPAPPFGDGVLSVTRYPPYEVAPQRYPLGRSVPWQRPVAWEGVQGTAVPRIYALPASLMADLPADTAGAVAAVLTDPGVAGASSSSSSAIPDARWATTAAFLIRRVPMTGGGNDYVPGMYELVSSVGDASAELLELMRWLAGDNRRKPSIELLYSAGSQATSDTGLRSDVLEPAAVTLLKGNLSTVTMKPASAMALMAGEDAPVLVDATMDDPQFLQLLWECSTVNAGGYFLQYGMDPAVKLPDNLFEAAPLATLTVLATVEEGEAAPLRSFHTALVTTVDSATSKLSLDVEPYRVRLDPGHTDLASAAAEVGTDVGSFGVANATNPDLLAPGVTLTQAAFAGGSYTVQVGDDLLALAQLLSVPVEAAAAELAVLALITPGTTVWPQPNWMRRVSPLPAPVAGFRVTRTNPDPLSALGDAAAQEDPAVQLETAYHLLSYSVRGSGGFEASNDAMPIAPTTPVRSGSTQDPPWRYQQVLPVAALAGGNGSPYAGVGATATLEFALHDLYGNRALPAGAPAPLALPVYYHDPLSAIGTWPKAQLTFAPSTDVSATLEVELSLDVASTVAAAADAAPAVGVRAAEDFPRYIVANDQLACPDVQVAMSTSLSTTEHDVDTALLVSFAGGARDYLEALSLVTALAVDAGSTLTATAKELGVPETTLGRANQDAEGLFDPTTPLTFPTEAAVVQGDTIASIATRAGSTASDIGTWNATVALAPKVSITLAGRPYTTVAGDTLDSLAERAGEDPGSLASTNADVRSLFPQSTPLVVSTESRSAGTATLRALAAAVGTTVDTLALLNAAAPLAAAGHLLVPGRLDTSAVTGPAGAVAVVGSTDTFASIAAGAGVDATDLIRANAWTDGSLAQRQPPTVLTLESSQVPPVAVQVQVRPGDTPASIAIRFGGLLSSVVDPATVFLAPGNDQPGMLEVGTVVLLPPARVSVAVPVVPDLADGPIVPLTVQATIRRTENIDPQLAGSAGVAEATSPVAAAIPGTDARAVQAFATAFETVFAASNLVLATSTDSPSSGATTSNLFVVQIDDSWDGSAEPLGIAYRFEPGAVAFAVPPVAQQPWSADGVLFATYVSGAGLGPPVPTSARAVDLDAVQRRVAADLDRFLEPASMLAAHQFAAQAVRDVVNAKYTLADAVSKTVLPVLVPEDDDWPGHLGAARETMRQMMLMQASQCYTTDALLQVHAHVVAPDSQALSARINGMPISVQSPPDGAAAPQMWTARRGDHVRGLLSALVGARASAEHRQAFAALNSNALLEPGQTVVVGGFSHRVQPGQTLQDTADALGVDPVTVVTEAPETLAAAGVPWALHTDTPPFTLTPAKLGLVDGGSTLTFGVHVPALDQHRSISTELAYRPTELEFGIQKVEGGYEESRWLTFVTPRQTAQLGPATIPLPLRSFPATPRITTQSAKQLGNPVAPEWARLGAGNFDFTYAYLAADQDRATARIAHSGHGARTLQNEDDELAQALAQYAMVADALWSDLGQLSVVAGATDAAVRQRYVCATQAFAQLLGAIANAWKTRGPRKTVNVPPGQRMTTIKRPDGRLRVTLHPGDEGVRSNLALGQRGALPSGIQQLLVDAGAEPPTLGPWPFEVPADQRLWGVVDVVRNASLVDKRTTTAAFTYALLNTRSSAAALPLVRYTGDLDLRQVPPTYPGPAIVDHLRNMFAASIGAREGVGSPTCWVRVTAAWEFGFDDVPPIDSSGGHAVPVPAYTSYAHLFDPQVDFGETTGYCAELAGKLAAWQTHKSPPTAAAQWCLYLTVLGRLEKSGLPGPPLLEVQRVVLPLSALE
jgi:LysM repeat protein